MQDCSNSSALAMELLQSCTKPSICIMKNSCHKLKQKCCHFEEIFVKWQLSVQPVMTISSKWCHFYFSVTLVYSDDTSNFNIWSQAITWTSAYLLSNRKWGTNLRKLWIKKNEIMKTFPPCYHWLSCYNLCLFPWPAVSCKQHGVFCWPVTCLHCPLMAPRINANVPT